MYNINTAQSTPENFFAGDFPVVTDFGTIENGAKIRKHTPIVQGENGIKETAANTLAQVIGIAAAEPSGDEVVYYLTGEFFSQAIVLPTGVTIEALKPVLRKLTIFLKEINQ